jgi:transposase-like protein
MSQKVPLPSPDDVRQAKASILAEAHATGRRPSVLALARQLGLTNATFWRHYPDIARDVANHRRAAPSPGTDPADHLGKLEKQIAELRRANRDLTEHLDLAVANIQRLSLDNHHLRQELEAATNITRLKPTIRQRPASEETTTSPRKG